jgi:hypothetical protein
LHRNRALNGDVVVCVLLPTQPTNKCENGCVENSVSPQNQPNKQPTPKNLAVVSELKENVSKMTKGEVQCENYSELDASREHRVVKNSQPKNKKTKNKLKVDGKNLGGDLLNKNEDILANKSNVVNVIILI